MSIYDRLEHDLKLSNLVNPESMSNLLEKFGGYHLVKLVVADPDGSLLRPAFDRFRFCDAPADEPGKECNACSFDLPRFSDESDEKFQLVSCPSGARYLRARVDNQFDPVGFVVIGPFMGTGAEPTTAGHRPTASRSLVGGEPLAMPIFSDLEVNELAQLLCTVVEEVVFANYQSYLFEKMHLQLSSEQLSDSSRTSKTVPAPESDEDSFLESDELSSLF